MKMTVESDMSLNLFRNFIFIIERQHKKLFYIKCGFNPKWKKNKDTVLSLTCKIS